MTFNKEIELLLRKNPSAIYIDLANNPSMKILLPTIKSSEELKILDETEDYIIIAKAQQTVQVARNPSKRVAHVKNHIVIRPRRHKKINKYNTYFTRFLDSIGIQAKSIKQSDKNKDEVRVINASGIIR